VAVLAAQGLRLLIRSHEAIRSQSDKLEELQIAMLLMDRDISQTVDRGITDEQNVAQPGFVGNTAYIEFTHGGYINPQGLTRRSTLQRSAYFLNNGQLILRHWPVLDRTDKTIPNDRILLKEVKSLQFKFVGYNNQFFNFWPTDYQKGQAEQSAQLPYAVQMVISFSQRGELTRVFMISGKRLNE
jgi:general secretion pathway protein J